MTKRVLAAVLGSMLLLSDAHANTKPITDAELAKFQSCSVDADCMYVQNGCCDCANGGQEAAIAKSQEEEFNTRFDCQMVPCTARARIPACGSGTVGCQDGRCHYFPKSLR